MPSINDIRKANPSVYGGLTDFEIVDRLSQLTGRHPDAIGYDLGVAPRNQPGFTSAFKSSMGGVVQGVGQLAADVVPGIGESNFLERYGREVQQRNPIDITEGSSDSALTNLGRNLMERPANVIGQIAGQSIGYLTPGGIAKGGLAGITALRGLKAAEAVGGLAQARNAATAAGYFGLPSYGQIREEQEKLGQNELSDILKAGGASMAVGAIESFAGPEAMLTRGGIRGLGEAGKTFLRSGLKQGAMEAGEELLQTPIETWAAGGDVLSRGTLDQALAGAGAGFIGGGVFGAAMHPLMRRAQDTQIKSNLEQRNQVDVLNNPVAAEPEQAAVLGLPNYAYLGTDPYTVFPDGSVATTPEQEVNARYGVATPTVKPVETQQSTTIVKPLSIDEAKTRKDLKLAIDQEFAQGNITEEQHVDAINSVDTRGKWNLVKIKEEVRGILTPKEQIATAEEQGNLAKATQVAGKVDLAAEGVPTIDRNATPEQVVAYKAKMTELLSQALTAKQLEALRYTRGVRNFEDSGWEIDPESGEELVPMSNAVVGNLTATSRQNTSKNANKGIERLNKRADELGIPREAAMRIMGFQGEQAIDTSSISEAQAAQAGLTYRAQEGGRVSANMPESEDRPDYTGEAVGLTGGENLMQAEGAQAALDSDLTSEGFVPETPIVEEGAVAEDTADAEETAGYIQDFDLSQEDYENAKDVWEILQQEYAAAGEAIPNWEDIPDAAFARFAAIAKYELNNPKGQESIANLRQTQQETVYGKPTQTGTIETPVARSQAEAKERNAANRKKSEAAAGREKPAKSATVRRTNKIVNGDIVLDDTAVSRKEKLSKISEGIQSLAAKTTPKIVSTDTWAAYLTLTYTPSAENMEALMDAIENDSKLKGADPDIVINMMDSFLDELDYKVLSPGNNRTVESVTNQLAKYFKSPKNFKDTVVIVQNKKDLPKFGRESSNYNGVNGFYAPSEAKVYLIIDNIAPNRELSVLMHELGVHMGLANLLDTNKFKELANQVREWSEQTNNSIEVKLAKEAMKNVKFAVEDYAELGRDITKEISQPAEINGLVVKGEGITTEEEEIVAYFTDAAVAAGVVPTTLATKSGFEKVRTWMKKMYAVFNDALRKLGVNKPWLLTAQDYVDLAYGAANYSLSALKKAPSGFYVEPKFSISTVEKTAKKVSGYTAKLVDDMPKPVGDAARFASDSVGDMAKRGLWYSMFTNDLIDAASKYIPSARAWYDRMQEKAVDQIKHEAEVDRIAAMSDSLSRDQFTRTWDAILAMTSKQQWGYKPDWKDDVEINPDMAAMYDVLSDEEKALVDEVFRHGEKTIKEVQQILDEIATTEYQALLENAKTDKERDEIRKQEDKYKRMFGKVLAKLEGPYAPMRRVGSHLVIGKSQRYLDAQREGDTKALEEMRTNPDHYWVEFVDSMAEAKRVARSLAGKYASIKPSAKIDFNAGQGALPFQAFEQIRQLAGEKEGDVAKKLNSLVTELYLTSLAETSSRKSELRRENVKGLNADTTYKAFVSKGRADAHYIATLKNSSEVSKTFSNMRKEAIDIGGDAADIFNELSKRYANSTGFNPMPVVGRIMGFNTVWSLLTKPAYYLYNATQPVLMTQPFLSQKHGYAKSGKAMTQAYKDLAGIKSYFKNAMLNVDDMPEDVRRALRDLMDAGKLDITITQDLGTRIEAGQGAVSRGFAKVDRVLRNAAQKVETTNRLVTAISAYRLAMATPNMSHENAVKYAARAIDQTQGDYSNLNAPRLFNATSFQRLITQFRKFQLIQISFVVRMFKDAVVGATPAERTAARRALMYVLGHHAILAGALGLPAANIIALAFSATGGDDEPKDLELELRKAIDDPFMADLLTRGVPAALFNINVSQNVGMGQAFSLMPFTDVKFDRAGYSEALTGMMGPFLGGVVPQMWEAMGKFGSGDYYQGLEGVMPSGARYALRAMREGVQGVTNKRGDELVSADEISTFATMAKILGFKTNDDANRQMIRGRLAEFEQFFNDRTSQLKKQYSKAYRDGDTEAMQDARDHWTEMNDAKRELGFKAQPLSNLLKAPTEERKRERMTVGGVQVTKSNQRFVQDITDTTEESDNG